MDDISTNVLLKLSEEEARNLDRVRGEVARATWVKKLINGAVGARERAGTPTNVWVINERESERLWPKTLP